MQDTTLTQDSPRILLSVGSFLSLVSTLENILGLLNGSTATKLDPRPQLINVPCAMVISPS